jgi:hypothetical protein
LDEWGFVTVLYSGLANGVNYHSQNQILNYIRIPTIELSPLLTSRVAGQNNWIIPLPMPYDKVQRVQRNQSGFVLGELTQQIVRISECYLLIDLDA